MLPEILFSVGITMQELSHDDFSILNGSCEKIIPSRPPKIASSPSIDSPVSSYTAEIDNSVFRHFSSASGSPNAIQNDPCFKTSSNLDKANDNNNNQNNNNINRKNNSSSNNHNNSTGNHSFPEIRVANWEKSHRREINTNKILLQNSDDPLISRGATSLVIDDDNQNEFNPVVTETNGITRGIENASPSMSTIPVISTIDTSSPLSPLPVIQSKFNKSFPTKLSLKKTNLNSNNSTGAKTRRKPAFRLRFHHQALPPEYLDHYEATQNLHNKNSSYSTSKPFSNGRESLEVNNKNKNYSKHDTIKNWLQKISEMQIRAAEKPLKSDPLFNSESSIIEGVEIKNPVLPSEELLEKTASSSKCSVKYSDLPYMGEITLENAKPRRGRKPKKADICHLIFKNYGTILNANPSASSTVVKLSSTIMGDKSDIKEGMHGKHLPKNLAKIKQNNSNNSAVSSIETYEEPLNLCLRDQSQDLFTISSDDEDDDDDKLDRHKENDFDELNSNCTTPLTSASDAVTDTLLAANLKMSLPNFQSAMLNKPSDETPAPSTADSDQTSSPTYSSWPTAGIFINPLTLYYQNIIKPKSTKLSNLEKCTTIQNEKTIQEESIALQKNRSSLQQGTFPKILPISVKEKSITDQPEIYSTPNSERSGASTSFGSVSISSSNTPSTTPSIRTSQPPQKRKRSAIFIPPIPAENTNNPATEVSICKFKFTGGVKPTLEEKKMLSVDADGNYRYYSGTGDKSMRGYEFFPRETLQQSGLIPGMNCSGAFLNATSEKFSFESQLPTPAGQSSSPVSSVSYTDLNNEVVQTSPDFQINKSKFQGKTITEAVKRTQELYRHSFNSLGVKVVGTENLQTMKDELYNHLNSAPALLDSNKKRKRKSRRSLQREKLEKTFKEKGFLIQTQQLESAEGATYCKFRQLRKFTRYLFRSWKDYLPGELQQVNAAAAAAVAAASAQQHHQSNHPLALAKMMEKSNQSPNNLNDDESIVKQEDKSDS